MSAPALVTATVMEALEPRLAPAGLVILTIAGGVLTITGDGEANGIAITQRPDVQGPGGEPGVSAWQISDLTNSGTQFRFNGNTTDLPFNIDAQNGIKVDLKGGDDTLEIVMAPSSVHSGMVLDGSLSVVGGAGSDTVKIGTIADQHLVVQGTGTFDMGDGNDLLDMGASVAFGGAVTFKGGLGADDVLLRSTGAHTFGRGLTIDLGAGEDAVLVQSTRFDVLGTLSIKGAGLATTLQEVILAPVQGNIEGQTTVAFAAGRLDLKIGQQGAGALRLSSGLSITSGNELDTVSFRGAVTVAGALTVDLKNDLNSLGLASQASLHTGSLTLKGGTSSDDFFLSSDSTLVCAGALTLNLGAGQNLLSGGQSASLTAGSLTYTGGANNDTLTFNDSNVNVRGSAILNLGDGTNQFSTDDTFLGATALTITGGKGDDTLAFEDTEIDLMGALTVRLGDGTNTWSMTDDGSLLATALTVTAGKGDDTLAFNIQGGTNLRGAVIMTLGDGSNSWSITTGAGLRATALTFTGGKNDDLFSLASGRVDVLGSITVNLGSGLGTEAQPNSNTLFIAPESSLFVGGHLTISGGAQTDTANILATTARILGNLTLALGDGTNNVTLLGDLFHISGNLAYTGGKGDDIFTVTMPDPAANLTVGRVVSLSMGDGANQVFFNPANGTLGSVVYKGGSGSDQLYLGHFTETTLITVLGGISTNLGAGTGQTFRLKNIAVHGALTVVTASLAAQSDVLIFRDSTLNGPVNITAGAGNTGISVENSTFRGNTIARLGAGNDLLELDGFANSSAPNTWLGTLYVDMDTGVDTINIGSATNEPNARNVFYRNAVIDTGAEADLYTAHNNHTFFAGAELRVQET